MGRKRGVNSAYTLSVVSALGISAATAAAVYSPLQTVAITANILVNGVPIARAEVALKIVRPDGKPSPSTVVSDSASVARYNHQLNKKREQPVIYTVTETALVNAISGTGLTTFEVK